MNKNNLILNLLQEMQSELNLGNKIALESREEAISSELKQEGKFDTRAIEAGYLASAQAQRLMKLHKEVAALQNLQSQVPIENSSISPGKIFELENNGLQKKYFLTYSTGGRKIKFENEEIIIISLDSPLGKGVNNLQVGDCIEIDTPKSKQEYTLLKIIS